MDIFDVTDHAEDVLPRRLFRALARFAVVVLLLAFWANKDATTAWLMRQSERRVQRQVEPMIRQITESMIPTSIPANTTTVLHPNRR
jgi:hypothetical protein